MITLSDMEGNEVFDASSLGIAEEVIEERIADDGTPRHLLRHHHHLLLLPLLPLTPLLPRQTT